MQFLGRSDFQVKIDGVRVEPGEVESALERHPAVSKAVVLAERIGTADNHLVAYVILEGSAAATPDALLADLRGRLPSYMVPAALHVLDEFPLTANKKIDRAALSDRVPVPRGRAAAATEAEQLLLFIWRELLPGRDFGVTDDLFSLGAGSILVIRLITGIEVQTGVRLTVRDVFEHPTVRGQAQLVDRHRASATRTLPWIPRIDRTEVALSAAQARLWYLQQLDRQSSAYHVPNCLRLEGPLQPDTLLAAIRTAIAGHESLRTVFQVRGDAPMQVVLTDIDVELHQHDFTDMAISEAMGRVSELARALLEQPFDLEQGPLCRFHLLRIEPELHVLVALFHHIAIDGWSVVLWNQFLTRAYDDQWRGEGPASSDPAARVLQHP